MQVSIAGEELWTRLLGSAGDDAAYDLFVTEGEDVYLTGYTTGDLGGVNSGSDSSADIFLAEYSSAGIKKWILQLGTAVDDVGRGIGTDDSQNIYVTGHTDGDLGGNTNAGSADIFLMKYNASQIGQWTHLLGTTASDKAYALCLDNQNNIYVSGVTGGDLDATGDETFAGGVDLFLMKYNPEGVRQWIRQLGTTGNDYAGGMDLDDSGNIYVTGHTDGSLSNTANAGNTDIFLAKFNPSGEVQWTRQFGTDGFDSSADVSIDSSDNIYVSGTTTGDLGGNGNLGYGDALLVKFDVSGEQY
ncbi:MAG: hypothetical protein GY866_01315 [Proteobacteria bacterium]|nr:hypothetical protein [Pseudomonadota bacterium]